MVEQTNDIVPLGINERMRFAFLRQVVRASWIILFLAIAYQLIFHPEITNVIGMLAVVFAWIVATRTWLRPNMLQAYLLSAFMLLGFASTQFYFPLLFTTIEGKPLIYNLEMPEEVFLHATLCLLVLVVAHSLYRFLMRVTPDRPVSLLGKAGFFDAPTHTQIWIMGILGMAASFYVHLANPDVAQEATGDPSVKALQALGPFMYAPFFIPIAKLYGSKEKPGKGYAFMIAVYAAMLFGISMAQNSRGTFMFGLLTPAFAYALGLLLGVFRTRIFTLRNVVVAGILVWALTGPFTDLGTAMLLVRDQRKDIPPSELITLTLEALDDEEAIEARRKDDTSEPMDFDWDERYLDNLFTARFANIKFNDLSLITYSKVGMYDPDMQEFSLDQLLASLPNPVLEMFKLDVDKEMLHALSYGDYLYVLSGGYGTPTGWRVGHIAGIGMATFGWWYLALLALVIIPVFYLVDKFFRPRNDEESVESSAPEDKFKFSFCGVLILTPIFQFLLNESVVAVVSYLIRGWIQIVILYIVMFHVSRLIALVFAKKKKRQLRFSPN
jgi:hypothetical protein